MRGRAGDEALFDRGTALLVAGVLASDAPASGNRLQSLAVGFAVFSLATCAMAAADMYVLSRSGSHAV